MPSVQAARVAVIYAAASGTTRDVAELIATDLTEHGAVVELSDIEHAPDLSRFDGIVLGSAVRGSAFLPDAATFLRTHRDELRRSDVWMFSVGPAPHGPIGRRIGRTVPKRIAALCESINPWDFRAFAGHCTPAELPWQARIINRLLGDADYGDQQDSYTIRTWSSMIAQALGLAPAKNTPIHR
ncbi:flavodoxin domain-containing protein [Nocardia sp. CS682]|uniref:flavodoxin domain-containing protein n=1 Tax=Nocardia sp. CS682 TaxID=1047172 RepID=UPI0010755CE4|nr:flavodoxin domain-containing protein [Nocardia sp. CS682]QBS45326.1 flavodoxin [Nocardia sp. CS682]